MGKFLQLIKREFKNNRTSLIIFCLAVLVLIFIYVAIYPSIQKNAQNYDQLLKAYPKTLLDAFGIEDMNLNSLEKFLAMEQYSFMWSVLVIIFALSRAGRSLAGEIEKGTMGLWLALPLRRVTIFASKYLAGLIALIIFTITTILGTIPLAALLHTEFVAKAYIGLVWPALFFGWAIYSVGVLFSSIFNDRGKVYLTAGGILVLMYVLNVVASLKDDLKWLKYISAFHYFEASKILVHSLQNPTTYFVFAITIIIATILGAFWFTRRDVAV